MRFLSIVMGVITCLAGVFVIGSAGMLFMSVAFPIGLAMLLAGFAGACAYMFGSGETKYEASWFLSESMLTIVLGALILFNQLSSDSIVPYVFGMFMLTSGIMRIVLVLTKRADMEKYEFVLILSMGSIGMLTGIYFFVNTEFFNFSVLSLVAFALIIYGINMLIYGLLMPSEIHNIHLNKSLKKVTHSLSPEELKSVTSKLHSPFEHMNKKHKKKKVKVNSESSNEDKENYNIKIYRNLDGQYYIEDSSEKNFNMNFSANIKDDVVVETKDDTDNSSDLT